MTKSEYLQHIIKEKFDETRRKKVLGGDRKKDVAIHVTHLTNECLRQVYYDMTEPPKDPTDASIVNFFAGTIIHEALPLSKENEVGLTADVRHYFPIKKDKITKKNRFDCLTGTIDDIIEYTDPEDGHDDIIIVDKKTFNSVKNTPKTIPSNYADQLNTYNLLLDICQRRRAEWGAIVYLDVATKFEVPLIYTTKLLDVREVQKYKIDQLDVLKEAVEKKEEPEKKPSYKCINCVHMKKCQPPGFERRWKT